MHTQTWQSLSTEFLSNQDTKPSAIKAKILKIKVKKSDKSDYIKMKTFVPKKIV